MGRPFGIGLLIVFFTFLTVPASADTEVSGSVFGVWTIEDSPYIVTDTLKVEPNKSLMIEPGVIIRFQGQFPLVVEGLLDAKGTPDQPIIFEPEPPLSYFSGIVVDDAESRYGTFEYVQIRRALRGLILKNSEFEVLYSSIVQCYIGIITENSNLVLGNSLVSVTSGGIVNRDGSSLDMFDTQVITRSNISDSFVLTAQNSNIELFRSWLILNIVNAIGTTPGEAVSLSSANGIIDSCYIQAISDESVIGVNINVGNGLTLTRSAIKIESSNESFAINLSNTDQNLDHLTIHMKSVSRAAMVGVYANRDVDAFITNTIFHNPRKSDQDVCIAAVVNPGVPASSNIYGSYSCFHNFLTGGGTHVVMTSGLMFENPLFADTLYHLQETSPCIDAGEPEGLDPDGTVPDIGMHYYHQNQSSTLEPEPTELPTAFGLLGSWPNPFNSQTHIAFRVGGRQHVQVQVYDPLGRQVALLADGIYPVGENVVSWQAEELATGYYFVRMISGEQSDVLKVLLLR